MGSESRFSSALSKLLPFRVTIVFACLLSTTPRSRESGKNNSSEAVGTLVHSRWAWWWVFCNSRRCPAKAGTKESLVDVTVLCESYLKVRIWPNHLQWRILSRPKEVADPTGRGHSIFPANTRAHCLGVESSASSRWILRWYLWSLHTGHRKLGSVPFADSSTRPKTGRWINRRWRYAAIWLLPGPPRDGVPHWSNFKPQAGSRTSVTQLGFSLFCDGSQQRLHPSLGHISL